MSLLVSDVQDRQRVHVCRYPTTGGGRLSGQPSVATRDQLHIRAAQVQLALKARGLRDDITVIVVDALPDPGARLPPRLQQRKSAGASGAEAAGAAVVIGRPLEQAGGTWRRAVWCARVSWVGVFAEIVLMTRTRAQPVWLGA